MLKESFPREASEGGLLSSFAPRGLLQEPRRTMKRPGFSAEVMTRTHYLPSLLHHALWNRNRDFDFDQDREHGNAPVLHQANAK